MTSALRGSQVVQRRHTQISFTKRRRSRGGPALDLGISVGRALSRGCESRSTEPPMKTASRRIRVTIPAAVVVAHFRPLRRTSLMRIWLHRTGADLASSIDAPVRGGRASSSAAVGSARPEIEAYLAQIRSCPARWRTGPPGRRSSSRGREPYSPHSFVHDVAGVASAATRACRADHAVIGRDGSRRKARQLRRRWPRRAGGRCRRGRGRSARCSRPQRR